MKRYRRYSDSSVRRVGGTDEWRRETPTNQLQSYHTQANPSLSTEVCVSSKGDPVDSPVIDLKGSGFPTKIEIYDKPYYTSPIDVGFASTEVVADSSHKTDGIQEHEEEEIYTATRVNFDDFPEGLDEELNNNDSVLDFSFSTRQHRNQHERDITFKPFKFETTSQVDSDSDSGEIFRLFPDSSSSDEEYMSSLSPNTLKADSPVIGNLPYFHKLDVMQKVEPIFKPPLNPLVSKRIQTATTTYSSDPRSLKATDGDATNLIKAQQEESVTANEETEGTFCTTNVQSALLNKIAASNEILDLSVPTSFDLDLPNIPLPSRASRKGSKSLRKVKPSKQKEDMGHPTKPYRKMYVRNVTTDLQNFESEVGKAFQESVSEGSVMPLLKQELHCKIQVRRLSMGQPELILGPEEPKIYELTQEELEKRNARLEQNRRSARNSRKKARSYEKTLQKIIKNEMKENARLTKELVSLQNEKDEYEKIYDDHVKICSTISKK